MLPAQHFKHRVHAFSMRDLLDRLLVIDALVVDAVLQSQFFYSRQLLIRRGRSIHFHAQQLADLHRCGSHTAGHRMNQNPWLFACR